MTLPSCSSHALCAERSTQALVPDAAAAFAQGTPGSAGFGCGLGAGFGFGLLVVVGAGLVVVVSVVVGTVTVVVGAALVVEGTPPPVPAAAAALLVEIIVVIGLKAGGRLAHSDNVGAAFGSPAAIGRLFLTDHLLAFEITSIVLLVAAIGGVILGAHSRSAAQEVPPL